MSERILFPVVVFLCVLSLLAVRKIPIVVRTVSVLVFAFSCSAFAFTGSLAPHRMAASKLVGSPSADWLAGAMATREAVQLTLILWVLPIVLLSTMCVCLLVKLLNEKARK